MNLSKIDKEKLYASIPLLGFPLFILFWYLWIKKLSSVT
jgi:hypothetical protein